MVDIHSTQSIADPSPLNLFPIFGRGNSEIKIKVPPRPSKQNRERPPTRKWSKARASPYAN